MPNETRIVVIGGTGTVGRLLLAALGDSATAPGHAEADLTDPSSLRPAFKGADALFLMIPGDGGGVDPAAVLDAAADGGVQRVVLLSSQLVGTRPQAHPHLRAFEDTLARSDLRWTVLRPSGFASNALAWAGAVRGSRTVHAPFGDVALPVIDPADIADCAAVVLRNDHHGRTVELTGPEAISPRAQTAAIAAAIGAEVRFTELSRAEAFQQLTGFMPPSVAGDTLDILGSPTDAERHPASGVAELLDRPARPFSAWAARNAAAFA